MKNAVIVHGRPGKEEYYSDTYPSSSNYHWIPWLQKQLIIRDIKADTPEMPNAYAPDWETWRKEFERFDISAETILVGHSNGAGFLMRWLSENSDIVVGKVILVAPSFNEGEHTDGTFLKFDIDSSILKRTKGITIFNGLKDAQSVHDSVEKILTEVSGVKLVEFPENGHFVLEDLGTAEFPELMAECIN